MNLCKNCQYLSYQKNDDFEKKNICIIKFWLDKKYKLSEKRKINKCKHFAKKEKL